MICIIIMNKKYLLNIITFILFAFNYKLSITETTKDSRKDELLQDLYTKISKNVSIETEIEDKKDEENLENKKESKEKEQKKDLKFKIKLGGLFDFQYAYTNSNYNFRTGNLNFNQLTYEPQLGGVGGFSTFNNINLRSKININPEFNIFGNKIGVYFAIPIIKNYDADPKTASQEYLYIDTKYIKIEAGSTFSAASKMRIDPQRIASGTGGVYGDWWRYSAFSIYNTNGLNASDTNALNFGFSPVFMIYPTLPNEAGFTAGNFIGNFPGSNYFNGSRTSENMIYGNMQQGIPSQGARSNKVSFYTKRFLGFQFGMSYSPNTMNTGFINNQSTALYGFTGGGVTNYMSFALNYKEQFKEFGFAASITYETGQTNKMYSIFSNSNGTQSSSLLNNGYIERNNLNALAVGFQLNYKNIAISYAYNNWFNSMLPKGGFSVANTGGYFALGTGVTESYSHVAGLSANYGPINFSIQYMHSSFAGNKTNLLSIGTDFKMASFKYAMIMPYLEYNFVIFSPHSVTIKENQTYQATSIRGHILIAGIRLIF